MGDTVRYMVEFFLLSIPRPPAYPIGVVAQDKNGCIYKAIPKDSLLFNVDLPSYSFYRNSILQRQEIITKNILSKPSAPYELDKESGHLVSVQPNEPKYFGWLINQGIWGPFWFGIIHEVSGKSINEVISEQIEILKTTKG